ncbi:hypothetical protein B8V81_5050 [Paenibacillus pasadenensis]|uniref:Uncharacterized protein n=1 Tax=Paenibacillus pasadenensis TaxID=217090 RepID=A0A2N5MZK2_9BACL|nr:hypothetical protein [Paenibacillus pasadenensis]PLT43510.1 hypothetical protein B8V81_5050 [Paenibacillus pasadenensis]
MNMIDKTKLLEWLKRELQYSQRENRRDEAKVLDMAIGKINSGAFDPPEENRH